VVVAADVVKGAADVVVTIDIAILNDVGSASGACSGAGVVADAIVDVGVIAGRGIRVVAAGTDVAGMGSI